MAFVSLCHCGAWALDGSWRGDLVLGQMKMPIVFNFLQGEDGTVTATIDSPNQGVKGIPADVLYCSSDSVSLKSESISAVFSGKISSDTIEGVFTQRGYNFKLLLVPETGSEERRPQTPKPPFAYESVDTVFQAKDGVKLAGTIVFPYTHKSSKMPMVVMVSGSGPQNRDEELFDHRPFAVLADRLAANGIASFRYDDRGVGASEGNFAESDTYVFADDARSAVEFVKSLPQTGGVGIFGHSEGGTIAFMLGADGVPDFIVSLAGMAISGKETLLMQNRHSLDRTPLSAVDKENSLKLLGLLFDAFIEQKRNNDIRPVDVDSIVAASGVTVNPQILASLKMNIKTRNTWIDGFLNLDPRNFLSDIKCPVLALNGDKDIQVNVVSNLSAVKESVKNAQVKSYPGLNHMFQHCETGEVNEYGEIRETMSEEVIDDIVAFILSLQ